MKKNQALNLPKILIMNLKVILKMNNKNNFKILKKIIGVKCKIICNKKKTIRKIKNEFFIFFNNKKIFLNKNNLINFSYKFF